MARKCREIEEKKAIYVFLEGESEEIYFKNIKKNFQKKVGTFKLFRTPKGGSDVFIHVKNTFKDKKYSQFLSDIDQIWIVFDTEESLKGKWEEYKNILKEQKIDLNKVKLLMTSKDIEYFFLLHYEFIQPNCLNINFVERLKKHHPNYTKTNEKIINDIYSKYDIGIKNSKDTVLTILKDCDNRDYKSIEEAEYDFYKIFFETQYAFSLIFQAFEYLQKLDCCQ